MRKRLLFCTILATLLDYIEPSQYALINCTWPCLDPKQGCIVTSTTAFCGSRESDMWMINEPQKSPFYTGAYVSVALQPCQKVPIPSLPSVQPNSTVNQGETVIQWPISSVRRPQDEYLGNCGHGLYCSSTGNDQLNPVCRHRLELASACSSSNQCLSRFCLDGVCQLINNSTKKEDQIKSHHTYSHPSHNLTGHILAGVFGCFGAIVLATVGFFIYRHRKNNKKKTEKESEQLEEAAQPQINVPLRNSAIYNNSSSRPDSSFLSTSDREFVEKQFASDFLQESIATPAMQQRHLQHNLRDQSNSSNINSNTIGDDSTYLKPPPSYKP